MSAFAQWVCSNEFHDLAAQLSSGNDPDDFDEDFQRLKAGIIEAEKRCREPVAREPGAGSDEPPAATAGRPAAAMSKYTPEILAFAEAAGGTAVYCFVLDGKRGTGGMPIVSGFLPPDENRRRCREVIALLRRSADLLEQDIGGGSVG